MLFNSYEFILVFLPAVLFIYFFICKNFTTNHAIYFLFIASCSFYAYWDTRNLPILLLSIGFNFFMGRLLEKKRELYIFFSAITINLFVLAYYKYTLFLIDSLNLAFHITLPTHNPDLPIGISFFTFTQIAYLVDVWRGETQRYEFPAYALFVTIFPHLVAGPILYHKDMIPQFLKKSNFTLNYNNLSIGIVWFACGLFKKVMIADSLAPIANITFSHASSLTFIEAWIGAIAYSLQLFFDFSGYSEMAVGLGLMLNFKLPINFYSPYRATSIIDFWRRWHISLSAFLRDYLYIPLGGNRFGTLRRYCNIMITMLLGGLWHGAGWLFVFWGGIHGLLLVMNHAWRKTGIRLHPFVGWCVTMPCVIIAWVFFRANTLEDALCIVKAMFNVSKIVLPDGQNCRRVFGFLSEYGISFSDAMILMFNKDWINWLYVFAGLFLLKSTQEYIAFFKPNTVWFLLTLFLLLVSLFNITAVSEFLYFQF